MARSAPRRLAVRTESMATLPPPKTTTVSPRAIGVPPSHVHPGAHQVDAREVLVGRVDALEVLAGDVEEHRQAGAVGDEDGVVVGGDLVDGDGAPDDDVALDLHAQMAQVLDLAVDDRLGQTELGDAVAKHAAGVVQGLEDVHLVAHAGQLAGGREAARAGADDGDAEAGLRGRRRLGRHVLRRPVGHEALQPADGHRLALLAAHADALALDLLRADAAGGGRQRVVHAQDLGRLGEVALGHGLEELGDAHAHRAALHAGLVLAGDAALGLFDGALFGRGRG